MTKENFLLMICALFPFIAQAESFSFNSSGSGFLPESNDYYYFYVSQFVNYENDEIIDESHYFSFHGILAGEEKAILLYKSENFLIYEGNKFYFSIPCVAGEKIYIHHRPTGWMPISESID